MRLSEQIHKLQALEIIRQIAIDNDYVPEWLDVVDHSALTRLQDRSSIDIQKLLEYYRGWDDGAISEEMGLIIEELL